MTAPAVAPSGEDDAPTVTSDASSTARTTWWARVGACCSVLVALSFIQAPGRLVADTKLDLAIDPGGFLARALHMWDPAGAFGQLQNQAYGYLFPMGPFFWAGEQLTLPGWVVQRLWLALVLVTAFLGLVLLSRALGVRSQTAVLLGGFAYALSPRMLTTAGPISIEAWPSALAPWVLLPLVLGSRRGSPRVAAGLSALAVAAVGGVNAAATFAVIPLGVVWLLTRAPGRRRRALLLWWPSFTVLLTLWWLVPLFLLGGYSPPFLDWIESAAVTTATTTPFDALRGTAQWIPYVDPDWVAGHDLVTASFLVLNSTVVLVLGVAGVARRDNPHRRFLAVGAATGLVLVSAAHGAGLEGWFGDALRSVLDGPLAPLRNLHKFDPVVRLPLVLGLAFAVQALVDRLRRRSPLAHRWPALGGVMLALVAVTGAAGPAVAGRLAPAGSFAEVPDYWEQAAQWLSANDDGTTALLVPGSAFGDYVWGEPRDEPLQPLAGSRWAVRNAVPLAPAGNIRMLDAVETRLAEGRGSPGLAPFLRRAGIGHLVVRNDLAQSGDVPDPVLVHQALAGSPGLLPVAAFGPSVGADPRLDDGSGPRLVANQSWQAEYPAVEVFAVRGASAAGLAQQLPLVVGGPEGLLELADADVLTDQPTLLAADSGGERAVGQQLLLTDSLRRRERTFGRVHQAYSPTLGRSDAGRGPAVARDYLLPAERRWETTARLIGARAVIASASVSDAHSPGGAEPEHLPYAAVDDDPRSEWVSAQSEGRPWWRLRLDRAHPVANIRVTLGTAGTGTARLLRAVTDAGAGPSVRMLPGRTATLTVPPGDTTRVTVRDVGPGPSAGLALAEVDVAGVTVRRTLQYPRLPSGWAAPDVISATATGMRSGCVSVAGDVRCAAGRASRGEENGRLDRSLRLPAGGLYSTDLRARPGAEAADLVQQGQPVRVGASSTLVDAVAGSAVAAIDGNRGTTWIAATDDEQPELEVRWLGRETIRAIRLALDDDAAAASPETVTVISPTGQQTVTLDDRGSASLEPVRTDQLRVRLDTWGRAASVGYDTSLQRLPVGVSELSLSGLPFLPLRLSADPRRWPCGTGPMVTVDGQPHRSAVIASAVQLMGADEVQARLCGGSQLWLGEGRHRISAEGGPTEPAQLVLTRPSFVAPLPPEGLDATDLTPTRARVPIEGSGSSRTLVMHRNASPGWRATRAGQSLAPVTVDGWQQGFRVPAGGASTVVLRYAPDGWYQRGLAAGGVIAAAVVIGLAFVLARRRPRPHGLPPTVARTPSAAATAVGSVLVGGVLLGWVGAAVAVVAWILTVSYRTRVADELWPWLVAAPTGAAGLVHAWRPYGSADGWAATLAAPQVLVVLSVALLLLGGSAPGPRRWATARTGRSTSR